VRGDQCIGRLPQPQLPAAIVPIKGMTAAARRATMTFLQAIFLFGSVLCCWSVLRCLGNERQQRLTDLEQRLRSERDAEALATRPRLPAPAARPNRPD